MQSPFRRLSVSEFEELTRGTIKHSLQTFSKLTRFASDDACQPDHYLRILSLVYEQLDANKIPRGTIGEDIPLESFDVAVTSLICLGVTFPLWLNKKGHWQELPKGLCVHWPNIRRWVLFLYHRIIIREDFDIDLRFTCKTAVLEFLGLVRDRLLMPWSKSIPPDREVMKMICNLWFIETRDPRFSSWNPGTSAQRESAVFNSCFLIAHEAGTPIDWENLLSLFEGDPELIATVSLCHLDREISHEKELDLSCIAWDLHIITVLSFRESICLALLHQGAIKAAAEVLEFIVNREWKGIMRVFATRCMINAVVLVRSRIEEMDALPFLSQALERGLIPSLLKCETLLPFVEQPLAHRELVVLLGEILPGYTVYHTILHNLTFAVNSAISQKSDERVSKGGELYKAWRRLRDTVDERKRLLLRRDVANGHIQTCQNDKCSKTRHMSRFKRCGGCLHAYYCSRECQRYDWQYGRHKQYCTRVHQRFVRTQGQMSTVHQKDLKFLDRVILAELKKHRERLSAHPSKLTLVDLNLIGGPANAVFDARGMNANPFGTKCGCEAFANARWKQMAEVVREGKIPMVLVRAFIPGGASRKIVLQTIPLSMVVNEGHNSRRNSQGAERYQSNLIFTCCGNTGKELKGLV